MRKSDRETLQRIEEKITDLENVSVSKIKEYDKMLSNLSNVRLTIKQIIIDTVQNGTVSINVVYDIPNSKLMIDEDGEILATPTFKSINMLDLLGSEDQEKLRKAIEKGKKIVKIPHR